MDSKNFVIQHCSNMVYPLLFIPKMCTTIVTNCKLTDNVYINVNITAPDIESKLTTIYSGFCNIKLVDSCGKNVNRVKTPGSSTEEAGIEQMPVNQTNQLFPLYSQSKVRIDPSMGPNVYNTCDPSTQEQYSICKTRNQITVEQHNTYITQNVYNCKEFNTLKYNEASQSSVKNFKCKRYRKLQEIGSTAQMDANLSYYEEDESERGVFLSPLPEEIMNETQSRSRKGKKAVPQENSALKQLMSSDTQSTSKQKKTIMFLGQDSHSGQTIPNILYNDSLVMSAEIEVDNEVVIDGTSSKMEKCCMCSNCGKILEDHCKYEQHSMAHGDYECLEKNIQARNKYLFHGMEDGKFGTRSDHEASGDFSRLNRELEWSDNLAGSKRDLSKSSRELVRSSENLRESMDIDGERIREADSAIAKICKVCLKSFDRIDALKRHLIDHVIRSTLPKSPISRTGSLKLTCEVCQIETFNNVDKYKARLREHAKLTIYKCTFCDKSFNDSSNFSKHKKIHGVPHLQCDLCSRKFKKTFTQHME